MSLTAEQLMRQREIEFYALAESKAFLSSLKAANARQAAKLALWDEMRAALHITSNMSPITSELDAMPNDLELMLGYIAEDLKAIRTVLAKCNAIDPPKETP